LKLPVLLPLLLSISFTSFSQTVQIKKIELAGDKVIVVYDLDDASPTNEYVMGLYASTDNFTVPMAKVKGDVGGDIKPGTNKRIEWNVKQELGDFTGDISLEVRGKVFVVFVKLRDFDATKTYKRGKRYGLSWKPGNANPIHIELYKGGERLSGELNHPNNGAYTLSIPAKLPPGKDYKIKITDSKNVNDVVYTDVFTVRQRFPLAAKLIIGGVAAGGILFLLLQKTAVPEREAEVVSDIDEPPFLPTK
jgi:hypothetical protein